MRYQVAKAEIIRFDDKVHWTANNAGELSCTIIDKAGCKYFTLTMNAILTTKLTELFIAAYIR